MIRLATIQAELCPAVEVIKVRPIRRALAVTVAAAVLVVAAGCSSSPSSQQVSGHLLGGSQAAATVASATGGVSGICSGATAGTQVIVKGPSGKLLATTNLRPDKQATAALHLPSAFAGQLGIFDFHTSIPGGSGPYTIDVVGVSNLVVPASELGHLRLTCG